CRSCARENSRDRAGSIAQRAKSIRRKCREDRFEQIAGGSFQTNAKRTSDAGELARRYRERTRADPKVCCNPKSGHEPIRRSSARERNDAIPTRYLLRIN